MSVASPGAKNSSLGSVIKYLRASRLIGNDMAKRSSISVKRRFGKSSCALTSDGREGAGSDNVLGCGATAATISVAATEEIVLAAEVEGDAGAARTASLGVQAPAATGKRNNAASGFTSELLQKEG
jgi:hypothetical protein